MIPAMATIDPEQERSRLVETYSRQTDAKLEEVAAQGYELTDVARTALRSEMTKRGLSAPVVEYAPGDELEMRHRLTIRAFRDLPEALLAKGSLDSAGIDCALVDDNVVRMDWLWSNSMGGVKLQVDAEDVPAAEEILAQPIPEHFDVSGVGEYEQPRCPKCGSLDINFQGIGSCCLPERSSGAGSVPSQGMALPVVPRGVGRRWESWSARVIDLASHNLCESHPEYLRRD